MATISSSPSETSSSSNVEPHQNHEMLQKSPQKVEDALPSPTTQVGNELGLQQIVRGWRVKYVQSVKMIESRGMNEGCLDQAIKLSSLPPLPPSPIKISSPPPTLSFPPGLPPIITITPPIPNPNSPQSTPQQNLNEIQIQNDTDAKKKYLGLPSLLVGLKEESVGLGSGLDVGLGVVICGDGNGNGNGSFASPSSYPIPSLQGVEGRPYVRSPFDLPSTNYHLNSQNQDQLKDNNLLILNNDTNETTSTSHTQIQSQSPSPSQAESKLLAHLSHIQLNPHPLQPIFYHPPNQSHIPNSNSSQAYPQPQRPLNFFPHPQPLLGLHPLLLGYPGQPSLAFAPRRPGLDGNGGWGFGKAYTPRVGIRFGNSNGKSGSRNGNGYKDGLGENSKGGIGVTRTRSWIKDKNKKSADPSYFYTPYNHPSPFGPQGYSPYNPYLYSADNYPGFVTPSFINGNTTTPHEVVSAPELGQNLIAKTEAVEKKEVIGQPSLGNIKVNKTSKPKASTAGSGLVDLTIGDYGEDIVKNGLTVGKLTPGLKFAEKIINQLDSSPSGDIKGSGNNKSEPRPPVELKYDPTIGRWIPATLPLQDSTDQGKEKENQFKTPPKLKIKPRFSSGGRKNVDSSSTVTPGRPSKKKVLTTTPTSTLNLLDEPNTPTPVRMMKLKMVGLGKPSSSPRKGSRLGEVVVDSSPSEGDDSTSSDEGEVTPTRGQHLNSTLDNNNNKSLFTSPTTTPTKKGIRIITPRSQRTYTSRNIIRSSNPNTTIDPFIPTTDDENDLALGYGSLPSDYASEDDTFEELLAASSGFEDSSDDGSDESLDGIGNEDVDGEKGKVAILTYGRGFVGEKTAGKILTLHQLIAKTDPTLNNNPLHSYRPPTTTQRRVFSDSQIPLGTGNFAAFVQQSRVVSDPTSNAKRATKPFGTHFSFSSSGFQVGKSTTTSTTATTSRSTSITSASSNNNYNNNNGGNGNNNYRPKMKRRRGKKKRKRGSMLESLLPPFEEKVYDWDTLKKKFEEEVEVPESYLTMKKDWIESVKDLDKEHETTPAPSEIKVGASTSSTIDKQRVGPPPPTPPHSGIVVDGLSYSEKVKMSLKV